MGGACILFRSLKFVYHLVIHYWGLCCRANILTTVTQNLCRLLCLSVYTEQKYKRNM
jgi:hypothetical protein